MRVFENRGGGGTLKFVITKPFVNFDFYMKLKNRNTETNFTSLPIICLNSFMSYRCVRTEKSALQT
jgi:hypothetical protein